MEMEKHDVLWDGVTRLYRKIQELGYDEPTARIVANVIYVSFVLGLAIAEQKKKPIYAKSR